MIADSVNEAFFFEVDNGASINITSCRYFNMLKSFYALRLNDRQDFRNAASSARVASTALSLAASLDLSRPALPSVQVRGVT